MEWICENCNEEFKTKKELIEHLKQEFQDANDSASTCVDQLEYLGVKNL